MCIVSCLNITVQLSALCAVLYIGQVCVLCCVLSRFLCCVVYLGGLCAVLCIEQVCVLCCVLSRFVSTSSGNVAVVYVNIVFSNNYCSNIK